MKYLPFYIFTLLNAFLGIGLYTFTEPQLQQNLFAAVVIFVIIISILGLAPFFMNAYQESSHVLKAFILFCLILYSGLILYYNVAVWAIFSILFTVEYYAISRIGKSEITKHMSPGKYLIGSKAYLKVVLTCSAIFSAFFWFIFLSGFGFRN